MIHLPSNTAATISFPLLNHTNPEDYVTGATFAAGDVKVIKDGGAAANSTNLPTEISNGWYKITLTAAELNADEIAVAIIDQTGTKVWVDQSLYIRTDTRDALDSLVTDLATAPASELASVPAATVDVQTMVQFLYQAVRNGKVESAPSGNHQVTVTNDAGTTIGTASVTEAGSTLTVGKFS